MSLRSSWNQIPGSVRLFFLKGVVAFIVWKFIYLSFLLPTRVLDAPLTYSVGIVTAKALNFFSASNDFTVKPGFARIERAGFVSVEQEMDIYLHGKIPLAIADACNGLELLVLYAGFLICYPSTLRRKLIYALVGFVFIYLLNIVRCSTLTVVAIYNPDYLDFAHHFVFTFVIYAFIIWLWFVFTKNPRIHAELAR